MDFKDLYKTDFQITDLFAMHQKWSNGAYFDSLSKPKRTDALLYLKSCHAHYTFENKDELTFTSGSTVFIPRGSKYKTVFEAVDKKIGEALLIEFTVRDCYGEPMDIGKYPYIVRKETPIRLADRFISAIDTYSAPVIGYAELRSNIYSLLSELSHRKHKKDIFSRELAPIAPAILYLEQAPCPTASVSELAEMCHVSPAYFRRLFRQYASVSPVQYRNISRIEYAKKLLENTTCTVSEIAATLGYEDAAYFCRVFKKNTGMTPGEYILMSNEETNS